MPFDGLSKSDLAGVLEDAEKRLEKCVSKKLSLDMSRGKPSEAQLALSAGMLDAVSSESECKSSGGADCRNYGELSGIPEMKEYFSELLGIPAGNICVGGNSTLNLMFDTLSRAYVKGLADSDAPWGKCEKIKFLCPVPGYDRHFAVSEYFGMEMISVPMLPTGPDMDAVESLVKDDASVKGIWCVPVFSNPTGCVYSDETVRRLASMKCAAKDFTVMWDNAYCVHSLYGEDTGILNILGECERYGNPNRALVFSSTNKITFAGAGVCCICGSVENISAFLKTAAVSTIGFDKLNMLRHARFLKNRENTLRLMSEHASLLRPKFEAVDDILTRILGDFGVASWTKPRGGYFISLDAYPGTAKQIFALCKESGVTLTAPGAAFPHGKDPEDRNIRIAPSFPPLEELKLASEILALAVLITAAKAVLG